jgi:hypothetical protein
MYAHGARAYACDVHSAACVADAQHLIDVRAYQDFPEARQLVCAPE